MSNALRSRSPFDIPSTQKTDIPMTSEELFDEIFARLMQVRLELSDETFRDAAGAALVAIGRVVLDEAERQAKTRNSRNIVDFTLSRAIRVLSERGED